MGSLTDFKKRHGIPVYEKEEASASSKTEKPNSLTNFLKRNGAIDYQERARQKQMDTVDRIRAQASPFLKTPQTAAEKSFDAIGKALGNANWAQQKAVHEQRMALIAEGQKAREEAEGVTAQIQEAKKQAGKDRQSFYGPATTYGGQGQVAPQEEPAHLGQRAPEIYQGSEADKTVEELEARQRELKLKYWSSLFLDPKFDEKSTYVPGMDHVEYKLVNRDPNAVAAQDVLDQKLISVGLDKQYYQYLKPDEIALYNYVYATQGKDAATDFMDTMRPSLYARQRGDWEEDARRTAKEYPMISSAFSVLTSPMKGIGYLGQTVDFLADGSIDQNAPWNRYSHMGSAIRDQVGGSMGDVGNFFYQTGMSLGDFATSLAVGGPTGSLYLMGTGAATDTVIEAKDRGLSDSQAYALGTVAGAAEVVMEKIGMDALFDTKALQNKGWLGYLLKNALAEGGEEVGTDIINTLADIIISKDKSYWQMAVDAYIDAGKTEGQAFGLAVWDKVKETFGSFVGGAMSGGFLGGIGSVSNKVQIAQMGRQLDAMKLSDQQIRQIIRQELDLPSDSRAYQLALKMLDTLNAGKQVSGSQIAEMLVAGQEYLDAQAEDGELPEGDGQNEGGAVSPATEGDTPSVSYADNPLREGAEDTVEVGGDRHVADAPREDDDLGDRGVHDIAREDGVSGRDLGDRAEVRNDDGPAWLSLPVVEQEGAYDGEGTGPQFTEGGRGAGAGVSDGGSQWDAGSGAGEQTGRVGSGPERRRAQAFRSYKAAVDRQNRFKNLQIPKVSSRELGIESGTDAQITREVTDEYWDDEMQNLAVRIYEETGKEVRYVLGTIQIRGADGRERAVRGVYTGDQIFVQADHYRISMEQVADHEAYHAKADDDVLLNQEIRQYIIDTFSEEELRAVVDQYIDALYGVYDLTGDMDGEALEEAMKLIEEEVFADAYAGINAFGAGADRFGEAVNERMDQLWMGKKRAQDNGTAEPTGPPVERYSLDERKNIVSDDDVEQSGYIDDIDMTENEQSQGIAVAEFIDKVNSMINKSIRSKRKLRIGKISKNHATLLEGIMKTIAPEFSAGGYELWIDGTGASHIEVRHGIDGKQDHSMASKDAKMMIPWASQNAESCDFIRDSKGRIKTSGRFLNADGSRPPEISMKKTVGVDTVYVAECVPDSKEKKVWITSAYIQKGSTGQKLNMEESTSPQPTPEAIFDGSATTDIVATPKRTVKPRFSYAGERAQTADLDALERAKEMQSAGVAEETIRQETGWFVGMDGKWRWEIDDSATKYHRAGDALFSQIHPEYARHQELMQKFLHAEITTEEHVEFRELHEIWDRENQRLKDRVKRGNAQLQNIIRHDALFEAYPQLRGVRVIFGDMPDGTRGNFDPVRNRITLNNTLDDPMDTLIHEIQHVIQNIEGFASGASTEYWEGQEVWKGEYASEVKAAENAMKEVEARFRQEWDDDINLDLMKRYIDLDAQYWGDGTDHLALQELADQMGQIEQAATDGGWDDLFNDYYYAAGQLQMARERAKLNRRTSIDLYRNTAGEIEARDSASRRTLTSEGRRVQAPDLGDPGTTVFVEDGDGRGERVSYSVDDTDSEGRELSAEQQDYFKDSVVRDREGRLLVVYHQTDADFTIFETRRPGAGSNDSETPFGIFLKRSSEDIGLAGKKQMALYANITNPLRVYNREDLTRQLRYLSRDYVEISDRFLDMNREYQSRIDDAKKAWSDYVAKWRAEHPNAGRRDIYDDPKFNELDDVEDDLIDEWTAADARLSEQAKHTITEALRRAGYDGIILANDTGSWGRRTDAIIALDPDQVKNVDNRKPTKHPDIRYSVDDAGNDLNGFRLKDLEDVPEYRPGMNVKADGGDRPRSTHIPEGYDSVDQFVADAEGRAAKIKAELLRNIPKEEFRGTDALDRLGVKVDNSVGLYRMVKQLIANDRAEKEIRREIKKAEKRLGATAAEKNFASGMAAGVFFQEDIPRSMDVHTVLELADYYWAEKALTTDMIRQQRTEINKTLTQKIQQIMRKVDTSKIKLPKAFQLNHRTATRNMITIFGDQIGKELNEFLFEPVAVNEAERIRFVNRMHDQVRVFEDSQGKRTKLNKAERALVQQLIEGRAVEETVAGMEMKVAIQNAAHNIRNGQDAGDAAREHALSAEERKLAVDYSRWLQTKEMLESDTVDAVKIDNAAEKYAELFDQFYEAINDFLVAHGYEPIGFIKGYTPHLQPESNQTMLNKALQSLGVSMDVATLPTSIAGLTKNFKPNKRWNPFFLTRNSDVTQFDIAKAFESYVDYMSDVFFHTDDIMRVRQTSNYFRKTFAPDEIREHIEQAQELRFGKTEEKVAFLRENGEISRDTILSEKDIDQAMDEYVDTLFTNLGDRSTYSDFVMWLDDYANKLAEKQLMADRDMERTLGRNSLNLVGRISRAFARAQVSMNFSSALNQTAQMPMILGENGVINTMAAAKDIVSGKIKKAAWFQESDVLTEKKGVKYIVSTPGEMLVSGTFKPLEYMDGFMSALAVRGRYLKEVKAGKSHNEAMKVADSFARSIMGSRAKGSIPLAFQSKGIVAQFFHLFQVEAANSWEHLVVDLPHDFRVIQQTAGTKAAAGALAGVIIKMLLAAFFLNRMDEELYGGTPAPYDLFGLTANFIASGNGLTTNEYLKRLIDECWEAATGERLFDTDPDETVNEEFDWSAALSDSWYNVSNDIPYLRNAFALLGWGDETLPIPDVWGTVQDVYSAATDEDAGVFSYDMLQALLGIVGDTLPAGRQMEKTVAGIETATRGGKYKGVGEDAKLQYPVDVDPWTALRLALFGDAAAPERNEYYASDFSALTSKQTQVYEALVDSGADEREVYDAIQTYRQVSNDKSLSSLERGRKCRNIISSMELSDEQKLDMYLGMTGAESTAEKFRVMMGTGMNWDQIMDTYDMYSELKTRDDLNATGQATEFSNWVDKRGYTTRQATTIKEELKFWNMVPAQATQYEKITYSGLNEDVAYGLNQALSEIKPEAGEDKVSNVQRWRACVEYFYDTDDQMTALFAVMEPRQYQKVEVAYDFGVDPDAYVSLQEILPDYDADGNGAYKQAEIQNAIEALGGQYSAEQKAVLWQLATGSKSSKKNPYSQAVGQQVIDAREVKKSQSDGDEGSFSDAVMGQLMG